MDKKQMDKQQIIAQAQALLDAAYKAKSASAALDKIDAAENLLWEHKFSARSAIVKRCNVAALRALAGEKFWPPLQLK